VSGIYYILNKINRNCYIGVKQFDKQMNFIKSFKTVSEAAISVNRHWSNIYKAAKGTTKTCAGFKWKFDNGD